MAGGPGHQGGDAESEGERQAASPQRVDLEWKRAKIHRDHVPSDILCGQRPGLDDRV